MASTNLYTFNPFLGVMPGIELIRNGRHPVKNSPLPPHVKVGGAFVATETHWQNPPTDHNGRLREASISLIEPVGKRSFAVFVAKNNYTKKDAMCVLTDTVVPAHVKLRHDPDQVNAWVQIVRTDGVTIVQRDGEQMLLEFFEQGDEVDLWYVNGHIARLYHDGNGIIQVPLTAREIMQLRIEQLQEQIDELDLSTQMRRYHGIIGGATRLLRVQQNAEAVDLLVDFLCDQLGPNLTTQLRSNIRAELLRRKHQYAGHFLEGFGGNVVSITAASSGNRKKAEALAKKRERAERDRQKRLELRGSSNGGGNNRQQKKGK